MIWRWPQKHYHNTWNKIYRRMASKNWSIMLFTSPSKCLFYLTQTFRVLCGNPFAFFLVIVHHVKKPCKSIFLMVLKMTGGHSHRIWNEIFAWYIGHLTRWQRAITNRLPSHKKPNRCKPKWSKSLLKNNSKIHSGISLRKNSQIYICHQSLEILPFK